MPRQYPCRPYHAPRAVPCDGVLAASSPRQNRLLAALPGAEYAQLLAHLQFVRLPRGLELHRAGEPERRLYFITAGIVSSFYALARGSLAGFSLTGREGVIGINGFLGGGGAPDRAAVLVAGHAYQVDLDAVRSISDGLGALPQLLLRYTEALMTETMLTAACNRHHSVEQQLSRRILSSLDRLPSNNLAMTQDVLADMLGVRREAITTAAGNLQKAGLIRYARGQIQVIDRASLQARACECYEVVRREYERLLPAPGRDARLSLH